VGLQCRTEGDTGNGVREMTQVVKANEWKPAICRPCVVRYGYKEEENKELRLGRAPHGDRGLSPII
jgi:hypothetical protein